MTAYDLYGVKDISILESKLNVEGGLGFSFEKRESAY